VGGSARARHEERLASTKKQRVSSTSFRVKRAVIEFWSILAFVEQERVVNGTIVKECRQLLVHVLPGVRAAERQMDTNISDLTDAGDWPPDGLELFGHHRD